MCVRYLWCDSTLFGAYTRNIFELDFLFSSFLGEISLDAWSQYRDVNQDKLESCEFLLHIHIYIYVSTCIQYINKDTNINAIMKVYIKDA